MLPFLPRSCHFLFSLSLPFSPLSFASAAFEVLNNEEPHSLLSSWGNPSWNSTAQRRGIFLHDHRWKEAETVASKVRSACGDNNSICTEPLSSDLTAQRMSTAWLDAKANVHVHRRHFHYWNLTSICFLVDFLWNYEGTIMVPFHVGDKALLFFFTSEWHCKNKCTCPASTCLLHNHLVMNALYYQAVQEEMEQNLTLRSNQQPSHILSPVEEREMCSSTPGGLLGATFVRLFWRFLSPSHIRLFCLRLSRFQ